MVIKHYLELLHESEANSIRLTEQAKVLRDEIRRLERNQEREKESATLEYLKKKNSYCTVHEVSFERARTL